MPDDPIHVGDSIEAVLADARAAGKNSRKTPGRKKIGHRPTKLTGPLQTKVLDLIRDGVPQEPAAVAVGISKATFHNWVGRGREAQAVVDNNGEPAEVEKLYLGFVEALDEARAQAQAVVVTNLQRYAIGEIVSEVHEWEDEDSGERHRRISFKAPSVEAMKFYLERGWPDLYSRRIEVGGPEGGAIPIEVEVSARDMLKRRLGQTAERLGLDTEPTEAVPSTPVEPTATEESP